MLAAFKTDREREIIIKKSTLPILNEDDVLVKVDYCGVCGSDLHAFVQSKGYEFVNPPRILGHEISGSIVSVGSEKDSDLIDSKVIVESMHYCNECENCLSGKFSICNNNKVIGLHYDGGMSEFVKVNKKFIREIPHNLPLGIAALSEPMSVAAHAVSKIKNLKANSHILIQGPGIIGIFVGLICLSKGAKVTLSGLEADYETRLSKAKDLGMDIHISNKDDKINDADIIFECSGSSLAFETSFNNLKKGGQLIVVALYEQPVNLFMTDLVRNEWEIITSYGSNSKDYLEAFEILNANKNQLDKILNYYRFKDINKAFDDSLEKKILKAILVMDNKSNI